MKLTVRTSHDDLCTGQNDLRSNTVALLDDRRDRGVDNGKVNKERNVYLAFCY